MTKEPMNNQTNRLAQLIAYAADNYRGVASGMLPTEQDKAAARAIEAQYLFIRRAELPTTRIIERDNGTHVEVENSEAGTWPLNHARNTAENNRQWGLEYLAASIAIQEWHDGEAVRALDKRREELAGQYFGLEYEFLTNVSSGLQEAIDRIIELEGKAA